MDKFLKRMDELSAPDQQELLIRCLRWFRVKHGLDLTRAAIHQSRLYEGDWKTHAFAPEDFARHCHGSCGWFFSESPSGDDPPSPNRACQRLVRLFGYEMEPRTTVEQIFLLALLIQHSDRLNGPWLTDDAVQYSMCLSER